MKLSNHQFFLVIITILLITSCDNRRSNVTISDIKIFGGVFQYHNDHKLADFQIVDLISIKGDSFYFRRTYDTNNTTETKVGIAKHTKGLISYYFLYSRYTKDFKYFEDEQELENNHSHLKPPLILSNLNYEPEVDTTSWYEHQPEGWYNCIYIKYNNNEELLYLFDTALSTKPRIPPPPAPPGISYDKEAQLIQQGPLLIQKIIYNQINTTQSTKKKLRIDTIPQRFKTEILKIMVSRFHMID
jgi:hypothetical protein